MIKKSPVPNENFFQRIVKAIVHEELKTALEPLQNSLLRAIDQKNEVLLGLIDKKNYDLRSDVATMKDEIVGELEKARQEQIILSSQHARVLNHEERLEKLEKVHPHGQHAFA